MDKKEFRNELSRRDFLKGTAVGVGAASLAGFGVKEAEAAPRSPIPKKWDKVADVVIIGYGAAGAVAAITAHDAGAKVLMVEKAPEQFKGGNSAVSGNAVFWPNDVEKAIIYFKGLCGYYIDNISEEMIRTWAEELYKNNGWRNFPMPT
jgi:NADPH-dependent 2,4-dienoyl-CoA reductase/sulfur reductase-like enzyme